MMKESVVQPNCGWGDLCDVCQNRHYRLDMLDSFPCHRVELRGFTSDPTRFTDENGERIDIIGPSFVRYVNGSEKCSEYLEGLVVNGCFVQSFDWDA